MSVGSAPALVKCTGVSDRADVFQSFQADVRLESLTYTKTSAVPLRLTSAWRQFAPATLLFRALSLHSARWIGHVLGDDARAGTIGSHDHRGGCTRLGRAPCSPGRPCTGTFGERLGFISIRRVARDREIAPEGFGRRGGRAAHLAGEQRDGDRLLEPAHRPAIVLRPTSPDRPSARGRGVDQDRLGPPGQFLGRQGRAASGVDGSAW